VSKSIYQAAAENDVDALRVVIDRVRIPDPDTGWTALHYAAEQNALEAARMLLEFGADPEAEDPRGVRPVDVVSGEAVRSLLPPA
jgi:ankyrin repeat protein